MHPFHRIGGGEGQFAGEHLVEGDPQGVEIAAEIDRPVHPAGLFGGHVGERPGDHLRRRRGLALARQTRGDAEAHEPDLAGDRVHQNIRRLDVLVDEAALVNLTKRRSDADREAQKRRDLPGPPHEPQQGLAAGVLDQERKPPLVRLQPQGPGGPGRIELLSQCIGVLQPREGFGRGLRRRGHGGEERERFAIPHASGQDELPVLPKSFSRMSGRSRHARASGAGLIAETTAGRSMVEAATVPDLIEAARRKQTVR